MLLIPSVNLFQTRLSECEETTIDRRDQDRSCRLYFAIRSREFRKFLAGVFLVSGGMQLNFYLADVSVQLIGTSLVQTPELSGRSHNLSLHSRRRQGRCYFGEESHGTECSQRGAPDLLEPLG